MKRVFFHFLPMLVLLGACAHEQTFVPEVGGPGTIFSHGGVVYSLPPQQPLLKMKLVSLGLTSSNLLHMRMYFSRKGEPAGQYMDPREQGILLPGAAAEILPSQVHAQIKYKPIVHLVDPPKQYVELLFPIPKGGHDLPYLNFHWRIHYVRNGKDVVVGQIERFDRVRHFQQQGVGGYATDADFPFAEFSTAPDDPAWNQPGYLWW